MKTYQFTQEGRLRISRWSFSLPDNDPPHRHNVLASHTLPNGDTVKVCDNIRHNVWWLTGSGDGFAGAGCSRAINSVCTRSRPVFEAWKRAIESKNVEIL